MEWLLFWIFVLGSSILWLAKFRTLPAWSWSAVLAVVLLLFGAAKGWDTRAKARARVQRGLTNSIPRQSRRVGYVSSDTCQSCHPDQYQSWHKSYHRTMTQLPSAPSVKAPFDRTLELDGEKYVLEQRGDEFWVEMVDPDWKHDQAKAHRDFATGARKTPPEANPAPLRSKKRITLLTGSHNFQAYWVPSERYGNVQFAFPFAWLFEDQRWVPRKDTFIRDDKEPSLIQVWNLNCIQCHSTAGQPGQDQRTSRFSTRVGEVGIACESCHGPAEGHVAANLNPWRRYELHHQTQGDATIVNPARLPGKVSTQACGQCHSVKWNLYRDDWIQHGFRYRPGDDLEKLTPVRQPRKFAADTRLPDALKKDHRFLDTMFWSDGVVRVTGREYNGLIESACHQQGELSCISCHSMHRSDPDDQLSAGMDGNEACFKCHDSLRSRLEQHTHHRASSSGSQCYNCHMPHLALLLADPYSAVRYIAYRSLRQIPGYERLQFDYVGPKPDLESARNRVLENWSRTEKSRLERTGAAVLVEPNGALDQQRIDQLLQRRDDRAVELIE